MKNSSLNKWIIYKVTCIPSQKIYVGLGGKAKSPESIKKMVESSKKTREINRYKPRKKPVYLSIEYKQDIKTAFHQGQFQTILAKKYRVTQATISKIVSIP